MFWPRDFISSYITASCGSNFDGEIKHGQNWETSLNI